MTVSARHVAILAVAALQLGAVATASAGRAPQALGSKTSNVRTTPGTKLKLGARTVEAGDALRATGTRFKRGEYVTAWIYRAGRGKQFVGGRAGRGGRVKVAIDTGADAGAPGKRKLCLQGERSRRIACATFELRAPAERLIDEAFDEEPGEDELDEILGETDGDESAEDPSEPAVVDDDGEPSDEV